MFKSNANFSGSLPFPYHLLSTPAFSVLLYSKTSIKNVYRISRLVKINGLCLTVKMYSIKSVCVWEKRDTFPQKHTHYSFYPQYYMLMMMMLIQWESFVILSAIPTENCVQCVSFGADCIQSLWSFAVITYRLVDAWLRLSVFWLR